MAARLDTDTSLPASLPLTARLEQTYAAVVSGLPAAARSLLLIAALDDSGQVGELLSAASVLLRCEVGLDTA